MSSKPDIRSKGFPLSSTPNHFLEDSGYCGSAPRRNISVLNDKVLSICSPINENAFKRPKNVCSQHKSAYQNKNSLHYEVISRFRQSNSAKTSELAGPDQSLSHKLQNSISQDFPDLLDFDLQSSSYDYSPPKNNCHASSSSFSKENIRYRLLWPQLEDSDVSTPDDSKSSRNSSSSISNNSCMNYKKSSPPQEQNVKQIKIDFISELKMRDIKDLISMIWSHLSPEDLCKACCVSKNWNQAIMEDKKARCRKDTFVAERILFLTGPSKENRLGMKSGPAREHKTAFCNITNTLNIAKDDTINTENSRSNSRFDSFMNNGPAKLCKCPICSHASKLQSEKIFMCTHCSHSFCSECLSPIFNSKKHMCTKSELPKIIIGSKRSKKNLKRL